MSAPTFPTPTSHLYPLAISFVRCMNESDYTTMELLLHQDFLYRPWPSSISMKDEKGGMLRIGKEEFMKQGKEVWDEVVEKLGVNIEEPVNVVEGKDTIVLQLNSDGLMKSGEELKLEYCLIFRFKDDKIISYDEWMDSAYAMKAFKIEEQ
ncbi:hypothetical protein BDY24DRAFT_412837 [Mrakia frigida]|uniref:nuclear transport factor 2 family protein n=1 Tax=Mrakia frigida TaxID=29902 RepID=UPI003FCC20A5